MEKTIIVSLIALSVLILALTIAGVINAISIARLEAKVEKLEKGDKR
ncbi:MAG: hypothetical protein IKW45_06500 [Clostridia bacterium]|nr:hypothetical protein [Clostridia bacterium]